MFVNEGHQQQPYNLPPAWSEDHAMQAFLRRTLPLETFQAVDEDCKGFEKRLAGPYHAFTQLSTEPTLVQHDQWGRRVDTLQTSEGWRQLKRASAQEGMVALTVERQQGEHSRTYAMVKTYLFLPESLYVGCPGSMTDGACRVLELYGTEEMKREWVPKLASRDPDQAWTSGQWMTEKPGGSDVSLTETVAKPVDPSRTSCGDRFVLDGFKWFSSAGDGELALALARTGGEGSRGLSLFAIKLRDEAGGRNGVGIHRLKNKWGTKALPTAELSLNGTIGQLVGPLGEGVRVISSVLNITRLHSATSIVSSLTRALAIAKSYAKVRHVGGANGSLLIDNEMHTFALASSELVRRALLHLTFGIVGLLGKSEVGELDQGEKDRLRLLTPVAKIFAADLGTTELPKLMEALGGNGYMVENQFGTLIADANVERIWEGTTNTLALDVVRVIIKSRGEAIVSLTDWANQIISSTPHSLDIGSARQLLNSRLSLLSLASKQYLLPSPHTPDPRLARPFLYLIGYIASTISLLEQALWSAATKGEEGDAEVDRNLVRRWCEVGGVVDTERTVERLLSVGEGEGERERRREWELVYGGGGAKTRSKL